MPRGHDANDDVFLGFRLVHTTLLSFRSTSHCLLKIDFFRGALENYDSKRAT